MKRAIEIITDDNNKNIALSFVFISLVPNDRNKAGNVSNENIKAHNLCSLFHCIGQATLPLFIKLYIDMYCGKALIIINVVTTIKIPFLVIVFVLTPR